MAINLLNLLKDQLSDNLIGQAAKLVGENQSATKSAIGAILPTILGSIVSKGSNANGASQLLNMITRDKHDGSMLSNLSGLLGGGASSDGLMNTGKSLISSLMGNNQNPILDLLGKATGLKRNSSSSLMNMLAPIVMGMIGKQVASKGLNASGLMKLLLGQKDFLSKALPAGMSNILGFANDAKGDASYSSSSSTSTHKQNASGDGGGNLKWWLLGLAALLLLGFLLFRNGCGPVGNTNTVDDTSETTTDMTDASDNAAGSIIRGTVDATGNLVDETGKVIAKAGEFTKDAYGNFIRKINLATEKAVVSSGNAANDAATSLADEADYAIQYTVDEAGNLLDPTGKIVYKVGDFSVSDDGYYVDKKGNRIGRIFKKIGKAIGKAAEKTGEFFHKTFSNMFKKKAGSKTTYELSQIQFNPENHRITHYSKNELHGLVAALKSDPNAKIQVQAHTSDGKNKVENRTLSTTRAQVVHDMLVTLGVNKNQISFKGIGAKNKAKATANKMEIVVE